MTAKRPNIQETRSEWLDSDEWQKLDIPHKQTAPNHYTACTENLLAALWPCNNEFDNLVIGGDAKGILPAKVVRDWLNVCGMDVLDLELTPDGLTITPHDKYIRTRARFLWRSIMQSSKNVTVGLPFRFTENVPVSARPTKSELMTTYNLQRARLRREGSTHLLAGLNAAFGDLQRKNWQNYTGRKMTGLLWQSIQANRLAHDVTDQLTPHTWAICKAGGEILVIEKQPGATQAAARFFAEKGIPFYGKTTPVRHAVTTPGGLNTYTCQI